MGWWKIRSVESGGIDWEHKGPGRLVNAIPGETPENYYNGDGPADAFGLALRSIEEYASEHNLRLTRRMLSDAYFKEQGVLVIVKLFQLAKTNIEEQYKNTWGRSPYPEELEAVFNFCTSVDYES